MLRTPRLGGLLSRSYVSGKTVIETVLRGAQGTQTIASVIEEIPATVRGRNMLRRRVPAFRTMRRATALATTHRPGGCSWLRGSGA